MKIIVCDDCVKLMHYYRRVLARGWKDTARLFGPRGARTLTAVSVLIIYFLSLGIKPAMDEAIRLAFSVGGFVAAWFVIFLVHLFMAPARLDAEREQELGQLKRALEKRKRITTVSNWKELQESFESCPKPAMRLDADWSKEGDIDHGWRLRGDPSFFQPFEALGRRGGKLVLYSEYCRSRLGPDILNCNDPIRVWYEAIRGLADSFQMRDRETWSASAEGTKKPMYSGYIGDVYRASVLLCLELQSREDTE